MYHRARARDDKKWPRGGVKIGVRRSSATVWIMLEPALWHNRRLWPCRLFIEDDRV